PSPVPAALTPHRGSCTTDNLIGLGDLLDRRVPAGLQHLLPAKRAGDRLDQCAVDLRSQGRDRCAVGREDQLAATALADSEGHFDCDDGGIRRGHQAALRMRGPKCWKPISAGERRPMLEFRNIDTYYGELHVL